MSSQSLNTEQHRIISSSSSSVSSFLPPTLSPPSSPYRNRKQIQQSNRHYPQDPAIEKENEDKNDHRHCHDAYNNNYDVLITKETTRKTATNYPTLLSIRSWIIASRIEKYYSIRIDRASNHRTVHILPENYQFCSWAKKFPQTIDINTSDVRCHQLFGICSAADVHFGKCSNFEPFVESQTISISPSAAIGTNNLFYTIKTSTNSGSGSNTNSSMVVDNKKFYINRFPNGNDNYSTTEFQHNDQQMYPLTTMISPPSSPIDRSMVRSRIATYRENLSAALELLTFADDEPNELEDLIRNFVREDRLRQSPRIQSPRLQVIDNGIDQQHSRHQSPDRFASQKNDDQSRPLSPTTGNEIDTRGRRILLKKAQAEKIFQNGSVNPNHSYSRNDSSSSSSTSPFLSTNREGVVQSRLLRFNSHNSQRPSSPTPYINGKNHFTPINESAFNHCSMNNTSSSSLSPSTPEQSQTNRIELNHKNGTTIEKTVFGQNPKSSSLARNKKLIEARNENSLPIQQNFATGIDLNQLSAMANSLDHGDLGAGNKLNSTNKRSNNPNNHNQTYFGNGTPTSPTSSIAKNFQFDGNIGKISTANRSQQNQHYLSDNETDIDNILTEMANNSLDTSHFKNKKSSSSSFSSSSSSSFSRENDGGNSRIHSSNINDADVIDTTNGSNLHSSHYHSSSFSSSSSPSFSYTPSTSSSLKLSPQSSGAILLTSTTPTTTSLQSNIFGSGSKFQVESSSTPTSLSSTLKTPTAPATNVATDISPASPLLDFVARNQLQPVNNSSASLFNHSSINEQQSGTTTNNDNNENTIDTFIKENENFFKSGHRLSRSLSLIENSTDYSPPSIDSIVEMKTKNLSSTLTDDEKALLDETLKMGGIYGGSSSGGNSGNSSISSSTSGIDSIDSSKSQDSTEPQQPPKRRIIFVSKPAPKPEPKPEPKYVNGKVVFGQTHVKPHHGHGHALQKGSVAERVMLFEKCPEKTSVTKHKLNELQRNRITNPNKIGFWSKFTDTPAPATAAVNDKTTANEKSAKNLKIANTSTNATGSVTGSATAVASVVNDDNNNNNNNNKPDAIDNAHIASSTIINNNKRNDDETKLSSPTAAALSDSISLIPTFRRLSRSNSLTGTVPPGQLPQFYYPLGRPYSSHEIETQIKRIQTAFERYPSRTVNAKEFAQVLKLCGIPLYWKEPLFRSVLADSKNITNNDEPSTNNAGLKRTTSLDAHSQPKNGILVNGNSNNKEIITCDKFINYWKRLISNCYDDASRFIKIITQGQRNFIIPEDFEPLIQDVIDTHPGLLFLKEAEEFHSRYIHTVIARIFYCVDRKWSGTITLPELKKSNLLRVIQLLEEEEDINQITEYFSYEHFYVIYCKFWELDQDHDLFISKYDLSRHNDSAISSRMIDRIFSGAVTRTARTRKNQMSYTDFVWFLLADEDKRHPKAIEYWFRCMDMDGDGYLSMYELEYFYSEQVKRMEANGIEALPFTDCLCQMIDLISPNDPSRITLSDLKNCRLTPIFFDTFFNLVKYLDHEQRDPFASQRDEDGVSMSDWDRYAAEEYEMLVAEESAQNTKYFTTSMTMETISEPDNDYENREYRNWHTDKQNYGYDEEGSDVEFVEIMSDDDDDQFSNSGTDFEDDDEVADDEEDDNPNVERMYILVEPINKENFCTNNLLNGFKELPNRILDSNNNEKNEVIERSINSTQLNENQTFLKNGQHNMEISNDIDDIGKEFYDYIKMEFESSTSISSLLSSSSSSTSSRSGKVQPIQLIKRDPINKITDSIDTKSSIKSNHYLTYEDNDDDDDDFY